METKYNSLLADMQQKNSQMVQDLERTYNTNIADIRSKNSAHVDQLESSNRKQVADLQETNRQKSQISLFGPSETEDRV